VTWAISAPYTPTGFVFASADNLRSGSRRLGGGSRAAGSFPFLGRGLGLGRLLWGFVVHDGIEGSLVSGLFLEVVVPEESISLTKKNTR
jgi:hypothetical protein